MLSLPFCSRPWATLYVTPDGATPECRLWDRLHVRPADTIAEALNAPELCRLRQALADGFYGNYGCDTCPEADPDGKSYKNFAEAFAPDGAALENFVANRFEYESGAVELRSLPITASIDLGYRCNFRCVFCQLVLTPRNVSQRLVGDLWGNADRFVHLHVSGGEPLAYKTFKMFLTGPAPTPVALSITTNGHWLVPEVFAHFERFRYVSLHISIDSFQPDVLADLRRGADPERLYSNLYSVLAEARRRNKDHAGDLALPLYIALQLVPTSRNVCEIPAYIDRAADLEVAAVHFCLLDHVDDELDPVRGLMPELKVKLLKEIQESFARNASSLEFGNSESLIELLDIA